MKFNLNEVYISIGDFKQELTVINIRFLLFLDGNAMFYDVCHIQSFIEIFVLRNKCIIL